MILVVQRVSADSSIAKNKASELLDAVSIQSLLLSVMFLGGVGLGVTEGAGVDGAGVIMGAGVVIGTGVDVALGSGVGSNVPRIS